MGGWLGGRVCTQGATWECYGGTWEDVPEFLSWQLLVLSIHSQCLQLPGAHSGGGAFAHLDSRQSSGVGVGGRNIRHPVLDS